VLDVRSFRRADRDTDQYLVVAEIRERLAVSKQTMYNFHMERFNLKKLKEVETKEQYHVEISNRFAALENLDIEVDNNSDLETIRGNIKISAKEIFTDFSKLLADSLLKTPVPSDFSCEQGSGK
jgi:hypothetical protein